MREAVGPLHGGPQGHVAGAPRPGPVAGPARSALAVWLGVSTLCCALRCAVLSILRGGAASAPAPTPRALRLLQGAFEGVNGVAFTCDGKLVLGADNKQVPGPTG